MLCGLERGDNLCLKEALKDSPLFQVGCIVSVYNKSVLIFLIKFTFQIITFGLYFYVVFRVNFLEFSILYFEPYEI